MLKRGFIAIGLFIIGVALSFFWGKKKQKDNDIIKSKIIVQKSLDNISKVNSDVKKDVSNNPPNGNGSSLDQLRNDWSE